MMDYAGRVAAATPAGLWYAEGGAAQVEIVPCADAFCRCREPVANGDFSFKLDPR